MHTLQSTAYAHVAVHTLLVLHVIHSICTPLQSTAYAHVAVHTLIVLHVTHCSAYKGHLIFRMAAHTQQALHTACPSHSCWSPLLAPLLRRVGHNHIYIYIQCIYSIYGKGITKFTVILIVYISMSRYVITPHVILIVYISMRRYVITPHVIAHPSKTFRYRLGIFSSATLRNVRAAMEHVFKVIADFLCMRVSTCMGKLTRALNEGNYNVST